MRDYLLRRFISVVPVLFLVSLMSFAVIWIIPGDPTAAFLGPSSTAEDAQRLREQLGLDQPPMVQMAEWYGRVLTGDLGQSILLRTPVLSAILERLPLTLVLAAMALIVAVGLGMAAGIFAATRRGTWTDQSVMTLALLGLSVPDFWFGLLLIVVFSVQLGWLPSIGRGTPLPQAFVAALGGHPEVLWDSILHILLPSLALAANSAAVISRLVRTSMLEVLREDFVRTAYAKGLRRGRVVVRHALRNALLPVLSVIGLRFGALLGGAVLTESIFAWPGLGQLTITAISQRDLPLIQGITLTFALTFALINLIVDLLYAVVDPRVRLG